MCATYRLILDLACFRREFIMAFLDRVLQVNVGNKGCNPWDYGDVVVPKYIYAEADLLRNVIWY